ncbi:hypothetical protein PVT68_14110 [Microbulbifer bruguierae]|uniref:Uncharacterized protein n=1 Tax=Microbulbifer bruguierae TaxID=3029061 RepID=A0ABY8NAF9_9GAMM|nr:hypothetical protein [Microbulbifer bruguierae]WGL15899.1 hypothetical protein PVT68_14110 [Microbulbifer bruguierae]
MKIIRYKKQLLALIPFCAITAFFILSEDENKKTVLPLENTESAEKFPDNEVSEPLGKPADLPGLDQPIEKGVIETVFGTTDLSDEDDWCNHLQLDEYSAMETSRHIKEFFSNYGYERKAFLTHVGYDLDTLISLTRSGDTVAALTIVAGEHEKSVKNWAATEALAQGVTGIALTQLKASKLVRIKPAQLEGDVEKAKGYLLDVLTLDLYAIQLGDLVPYSITQDYLSNNSISIPLEEGDYAQIKNRSSEMKDRLLQSGNTPGLSGFQPDIPKVKVRLDQLKIAGMKVDEKFDEKLLGDMDYFSGDCVDKSIKYIQTLQNK